MACLGLLLAALFSAQFPRTPEEARSLRYYGPPTPVTLDQIALQGDSYQRRNVSTKGVVEPLELGRFWALADGTARVVLIPAESYGADVDSLMGRQVEVTGIVRRLKSCEREPFCPVGHCSICEDQELPPVPDPRIDWPRFSITVLSISDVGPANERSRGGDASSLTGLLADPNTLAGREIRVVGQFRGRNLFGDLPAGSRRDPSDWVLREGRQAVWVTGRRPQGKGWALDPELVSDTRRWLEVEGRVEIVGQIVYIRASRVKLAAPPAAEP